MARMLHRLLDVFASLNSSGVKYLVIGGIAAIAYGVPRATFDLDVLIEANPENARRLLDSLGEIRFGTALLTSPEDLLAHDLIASKRAAGRAIDLEDVRLLDSGA